METYKTKIFIITDQFIDFLIVKFIILLIGFKTVVFADLKFWLKYW